MDVGRASCNLWFRAKCPLDFGPVSVRPRPRPAGWVRHQNGAMPARSVCLLAALLVVQVVAVGCGTTSVETMEARVGGMSGVARVEAWQEPGDGLPFIFQVPMNLEVVMDAESSRADILDVVEAYEKRNQDGVVGRLELSLRGPARATLVTGGAVSEETVDDLLAARGDRALTRYRAQETNLGRRMDLTLATGGLDEVIATVERYRQVEGIHLVSVRLGRFVLMVDDSVWEAELTEARVRFIREVMERFRLRAVNVGYPHLMTLWVHAADVKGVRRLLEPHSDLGYAHIQAHRSPAQSATSSRPR